MTTLLQARTDLRDVLKDTNVTNQKWTDSQLNIYLNRGINQLWPEVFIRKDDTSQTTLSTTRRYNLAATVPLDGLVDPPVRQVYIGPLTGTNSGLFLLVGGFDPLQEEIARNWYIDYTAKQLVLPGDYGTGRTIRMVYQQPVANLVLDTDIFQGTDSAKDAIMAYAEGEAYRQRERPSISDPAKLANLMKLQTMNRNDFQNLISGPGGAGMQSIPLIR